MAVCIDLNCDLGEHLDAHLDEGIMAYISSCNIASGGHAGNHETILRTIELAMKHEVNIGIHPSFPDREHFGRRVMDISKSALKNSLIEQMNLVISLAQQLGAEVKHMKPHGALYNESSRDVSYASLIAESVLEVSPDLMLVGLAHSKSEEVTKAKGLSFIGEAFADRRYHSRAQLVSRALTDAVIDQENSILEQVGDIVFKKEVATTSGYALINAQTICLHSDTKGAVALAQSIHKFIVNQGGQIGSF